MLLMTIFTLSADGIKSDSQISIFVFDGCISSFLIIPSCFQQDTSSESVMLGAVWKRINPFPNKPCVCSISLLKTLREKEKLLVTSNFSLSHSVFYQFQELSAIFIKFEIVVCKLF